MKKVLFLIIIVIIIFFTINFDSIKNEILIRIYPREYNKYVEKYAKEYNVDDKLIYAIIKAESNFNENAISSKGAIGLMQLMESTGKEAAKKINLKITKDDLIKPRVNINLGTKYISILLEKYNNIGLALAAYNAGSGNVDSWIENKTINSDGSNLENIPYKETNNYVRKILRDYKIYDYLYD